MSAISPLNTVCTLHMYINFQWSPQITTNESTPKVLSVNWNKFTIKIVWSDFRILAFYVSFVLREELSWLSLQNKLLIVTRWSVIKIQRIKIRDFYCVTETDKNIWYRCIEVSCIQNVRYVGRSNEKIVTFAVRVIFLILIQKVVIRGCTGDCKMRIICTPTILCLISFSIKSNVAKRGPHHPKSEIDKGRQKMDEHFAHGVE